MLCKNHSMFHMSTAHKKLTTKNIGNLRTDSTSSLATSIETYSGKLTLTPVLTKNARMCFSRDYRSAQRIALSVNAVQLRSSVRERCLERVPLSRIDG